MAMLPRTRPRRPWFPWVRAGITLAVLGLAGWGLLEFGTRYLGLQKLVIEQVNVSGCRGERQLEIQKLAKKVKMYMWYISLQPLYVYVLYYVKP